MVVAQAHTQSRVAFGHTTKQDERHMKLQPSNSNTATHHAIAIVRILWLQCFFVFFT
jgi:hypothetical protein